MTHSFSVYLDTNLVVSNMSILYLIQYNIIICFMDVKTVDVFDQKVFSSTDAGMDFELRNLLRELRELKKDGGKNFEFQKYNIISNPLMLFRW